jgi:hypothetical protein
MKQSIENNRQSTGEALKEMITDDVVIIQQQVESLIESYIENCKDVRRISSNEILYNLLGEDAAMSEDFIYYFQHISTNLLAFFADPENAQRYAEKDKSSYNKYLPECLRRLVWMAFQMDNRLTTAEVIKAELNYCQVDRETLLFWKERYTKLLSGKGE